MLTSQRTKPGLSVIAGAAAGLPMELAASADRGNETFDCARNARVSATAQTTSVQFKMWNRQQGGGGGGGAVTRRHSEELSSPPTSLAFMSELLGFFFLPPLPLSFGAVEHSPVLAPPLTPVFVVVVPLIV